MLVSGGGGGCESIAAFATEIYRTAKLIKIIQMNLTY